MSRAIFVPTPNAQEEKEHLDSTWIEYITYNVSFEAAWHIVNTIAYWFSNLNLGLFWKNFFKSNLNEILNCYLGW